MKKQKLQISLNPLWLEDQEVNDLCWPLIQYAAQIRYLIKIGFVVKRKRNGRALVSRKFLEEFLGNSNDAGVETKISSMTPNIDGLLLQLKGKQF